MPSFTFPNGVTVPDIPEDISERDFLDLEKWALAKTATAPAVDTAAAIQQAKAAGVQVPVSPTPSPWPSAGELYGYAQRGAEALVAGPTLGVSRHLQAGLESMLPGGGTYSEQLAQNRKAQEDYAQIAPYVQGGLEAASGMATGAAEGKALMSLPKMLHAVGPKAGKMTGRGIGATMILGGAEGAVSGAANAPEGQRGTGAIMGGAIGAAAPAALLPVGYLAGKGYRGVMGALSKDESAAQKTSRLAGEAIGGYMNSNKVTPGRAGANAVKLGPNATLTDAMGLSGPALLQQTAKESPDAARALEAGMLAQSRTDSSKLVREVGLASRLPKAPMVERLEKAVGFDVPAARAERDRLVKFRKDTAADDYAFLKGETVEFSPEEVKWLSLNQKALIEAREIAAARNDMEAYEALGKFLPEGKSSKGAKLAGELDAPIEGVAFPGVAGGAAGVVVPAQSAAKMASSIKKIGRGLTTDLTGSLSDRGSALVDLGDGISKIISRSHPESYGKAQANYAVNSKIISAFDVGKNAPDTLPAELARLVGKMSPAEVKAAQLGWLDVDSAKMGNAVPDSKGVYSFLQKGNEMEKRALLFGKDKAAKLQKIVDETEAANLLNAASQGGGASLKSFLVKPDNKKTLMGILGEKQVSRLHQLADRDLTFAATEDAARAGVLAGAQKSTSGFSSNDQSILDRVLKGHSYRNWKVAPNYVAGAVLDAASALKGHPPEVIAKVGEIISSSKDASDAIIRVSNAHLNKATKDRVIATLSSQRRAGAGLGAAMAIPGIIPY